MEHVEQRAKKAGVAIGLAVDNSKYPNYWLGSYAWSKKKAGRIQESQFAVPSDVVPSDRTRALKALNPEQLSRATYSQTLNNVKIH